MGGGAADWISSRKGLDEDESKATALSGMSGAFAGLFSSPLLAMLLTLEIARPVRRVVPTAFFGSLVASSVSLGIYFALVGSLFIGIYEIPQYDYQDWHLLAGVGLGVLAAVIVMMQFGLLNILKKLFSGLTIPRVLVPVIGGTLFGLIGFALPLTNFTGSHQLATALQNLSSLGLGLLIAIMIGKMLAFAVAESTGFIGGPIFPILFVGGVSGMIVNAIVPGIPLGLAFTAMLAAVPGAVVSAPFSMVILAVLLTQVGAIQTGPILVAVGASSLTIAALRFLIAKRAAVATPRSDEEQAV
jgi:H+/Cl- antiporter ClcA